MNFDVQMAVKSSLENTRKEGKILLLLKRFLNIMTKRSENELSAQVGLVNNLRGERGKELLTFMLVFS